jgi:PGF-CTERM protein
MRIPATVAFALLLVLAGVAPGVAAGTAAEPAVAPPGSTTLAQAEAPPDPPNDTIGWENGYWHNESVDVDQSDGLSDAELEAYVARAMARVEYLREREFDRTVPVEVISREEYRQRQDNASTNATYNRWNDQVWEALFIVGESTGSAEAISTTFGSSVAGFYSPGDDQIKLVTDSPGSPTLDNATLVHELVHALQDQEFNLTNDTFRGTTQDGDLAVDGVVEGEANYIEQLYVDRCGVEWECVETPASEGGPSGPGPNLGVLVTVLQPYSDGPLYVRNIVREGGWPAFEERFVDPPASTEQVIHLTDERPVPIEFEDRATDGWETFPDQGENGSDTVGEASVYAMFWYQSRTADADAVDWRDLLRTDSRFDTYDYSARPSAGWGNDRLFPYRSGTGDDAEYGYVWVTEWDTAADAREFERAYESVLSARDARRTDDGVHVIDDGEFADAFRVVRDGTRVTIVNGPTPADVESIRPGLQAPDPTPTPASPTPRPTADETPRPTADETPRPTADETTTTTTDRTEAPAVGFGVGAALVALLAAAFVLVRRRR